MGKLSIVFSSHKDESENNRLISYFRRTSGVSKVEVLCYENFNEYSLPEVYNKALKESSGDVVVFLHNDVYFDTPNWGRKILTHFTKTDYGILGVAGTTDLPESGRWWEQQHRMLGIVNHQNEQKKWESKYCNNFGKEIIPALILDGVLIAVHKHRIKAPFNENYKGFHFYDIPFCVDNYRRDVKVGVMFDVRLTHLSVGQTNDEWENNRKQFIKEYSGLLPLKLKKKTIDVNHKEVHLLNQPKVSVIIPSKNNSKYLLRCLKSFHEKTIYKNYEIIIADTGSEDKELKIIEDAIQSNTRIVRYDYYNFAKINNDVVRNHVDNKTELLLFCNDDIELVNDALSRVVKTYVNNKHNVGTVGARLHYEDKSIQHSSIVGYWVVDKGLKIGHYGFKSYYMYYDAMRKNVLGNTGAFMLIDKHLFRRMGSFNENYRECYEDVELNIKCFLDGRVNILAGDSVCIHSESVSRKKSKEKQDREAEDYSLRLMPLVQENLDSLKSVIPQVRLQ